MSDEVVGTLGPATAHVGQSVTLRTVVQEDYPLFLAWRTDLRDLHAWAAPRLIPSVEGFNAEMDRLLNQTSTLIALDNQSGEPIGFLQAYNVNATDGWCMVRVYFEREHRGQQNSLEACLVFLDYVLANVVLRKIYIDLHEFNRGLLGSVIEDGLAEEGRFHQHTWYDGEYWDAVRLALYRERWPELRERLRLILGVRADAAELLAEKPEDAAGPTDVDP